MMSLSMIQNLPQIVRMRRSVRRAVLTTALGSMMVMIVAITFKEMVVAIVLCSEKALQVRRRMLRRRKVVVRRMILSGNPTFLLFLIPVPLQSLFLLLFLPDLMLQVLQ